MSTPGEVLPAHEVYLACSRFSSLDGLRAVSITAVIWAHTGSREGILGQGFHGVDLFFAISGFLITTLLLREHSARGRIDLRAFYIRRALRIFPLYYAALAVYALVWFLRYRGSPVGDRFVSQLPAFATYTTNWFVHLVPGEGVLFFHSWSLATEEQFYLLWPPALLPLLSLRRGLLLATLALSAVSAADVMVTYMTGETR